MYIAALAAVHEPQYTRVKRVSRVLRRFMYWDGAAVGVDVTQFESFYTVRGKTGRN